MGPGRLALLEDGTIGWGDLAKLRQTPNWRPSYVPTPLRDLQQRVDRGLPPTRRPRPRPAAPARQAPPARLGTTTLPIPQPRTRLGTTSLPLPSPPPPRWIDHDEALQMQARMNAADGPWTDKQRTALDAYTGQAYVPMNNWLRQPQVRQRPDLHEDPLYPWSRVTEDLIPNAAAAMRPLPERVTVSRRTGPQQFGLESWDPDALLAMRGQVVQDPGFLSTTIRPGTAHVMPDALRAFDIEMTIDVPRGYPAAYLDEISQFPGERELLLQAGTRMRILEVERIAGGGIHMRMVVLP